MSDMTYYCKDHGIRHYRGRPNSLKIYPNNADGRLCMFSTQNCNFRAKLCFYHYGEKEIIGIETSVPCRYGLSESDDSSFSCSEQKGIFIRKNEIDSCFWGVHKDLTFSMSHVIEESSICCMRPTNKLTSYSYIEIGAYFFLNPKMAAVKVVGQCIWMGFVNNVQCISGQMKESIGASLSLTFNTMNLIKIKDNTVLVRAEDIIAVTSSNIPTVGLNGLISVLHMDDIIETNSPIIGLRVKVMYNQWDMTAPTEVVYGTIRWTGKIKEEQCVGMESDHKIDRQNDPCISALFDSQPGHGCLVLLKDVELDIFAYLVPFTTNIRNLLVENDDDSWFVENWNCDRVELMKLQRGMKVFIDIEKDNRRVQNRGILETVGLVKGDNVCIVKVGKIPEVESYLKKYRLSSVINKLFKERPCLDNETSEPDNKEGESSDDTSKYTLLLVDVSYICRYSRLDFDIPHKEDCPFLQVNNKTPYGTVKWKGIDVDDNLLYGFMTDKSSCSGTDGTFYGQRLFDCPSGKGVLLRATDISKEFDETWKHFSSDECTLRSEEEDNSNVFGLLIEKALEETDLESLNFILKNWPQAISGDTIQQVVKVLLESRKYDLIKSVLMNYCSDQNRDSVVLSAAAQCLFNGQDSLCGSLLQVCHNKDTILGDGETFLTLVIKRNVSEPLILKMCQIANFDPCKCNAKNESPKHLACDKAMLNLLKMFLSLD